ncbi:MAG TPA: PQQ-binding-like beta-propeller repeat protein [Planctomycetaceae bacterium]|nr:PQQ-binding-like beta-propeller repeat protein [Planctomycetaceae bacterium]
MPILTAACGLALSIVSGTPAPASAPERWTAFRGSDGSGISQAEGLPLRWSETENVRWKTPVHGRGWSSPVVWGDQVWITTASEDGRTMSAMGVDRETGRVVHDLLLFENEEPDYCHPTNSYASPTPAIEDGRVYLHFGTYGTACVDTASGDVLWRRRDLNCDHFRGPGSSPILHGDLVILHFDGFDRQFVAALDKRTGETVWRRDRDIDYGTDNGDYKKAYSTPLVIEHGGRAQLISPAAVATIAYDPATGEELWRVRHGAMNAAARPVYAGGLLYVAPGDGNFRLQAVRPDGAGDVTDTHVVWKTNQSVPRRSTPLVLGELLFMMEDGGTASCLDARSGEQVWRERVAGAYWASPVAAGGRVYFFSQEGRTPVIEAGREFRIVADNQLDAGFNATPAIAGRAIYARTFTHLYRLENGTAAEGGQ